MKDCIEDDMLPCKIFTSGIVKLNYIIREEYVCIYKRCEKLMLLVLSEVFLSHIFVMRSLYTTSFESHMRSLEANGSDHPLIHCPC